MDFDIKKKAVPEPVKKDFSEYQATAYTDQEQDKLLIGYDPVPQEALLLLRAGTHVRYMTTAGDFRRGGFVHNIKTKGKPMIFLETGRDPKVQNYAKWPLAIEDISTLWKKRTLEDVTIQQNKSSPELENRILALEGQVEHILSEIKKIIVAVVKLNNKISAKQPMMATIRPVNQ